LPRALAAARAAWVRSDMAFRSLNAGVHERRDEGKVRESRSSLAVTSLAMCLPAGIDRPCQLWPIGPLAALDLGEFPVDLPGPAVEVVPDGLSWLPGQALSGPGGRCSPNSRGRGGLRGGLVMMQCF
jgi:hypothetical protein